MALIVSTHSCKRNEKCYAYDNIFNVSNFKIISIPIINYVENPEMAVGLAPLRAEVSLLHGL